MVIRRNIIDRINPEHQVSRLVEKLKHSWQGTWWYLTRHMVMMTFIMTLKSSSSRFSVLGLVLKLSHQALPKSVLNYSLQTVLVSGAQSLHILSTKLDLITACEGFCLPGTHLADLQAISCDRAMTVFCLGIRSSHLGGNMADAFFVFDGARV